MQSDNISGDTYTFSGLKSGTRYTLTAYWGNNQNNVFAKACFRTAYAGDDMNTPFGGAGSIGGTSGCFALGGEHLGGGDAAMRRSGRVSAGRGTGWGSGRGRARWSRARTSLTIQPTSGC